MIADPRQLAVDTARVFSSDAGLRVLAHLRTLTRDRVLGPDAPDALLRHVEGQRALVRHLETLIERGRQPATASQQSGETDHDD
ncbi:MAG: hypothetical protein RIC16_14965 [Rhodospirillales bacterium]